MTEEDDVIHDIERGKAFAIVVREDETQDEGYRFTLITPEPGAESEDVPPGAFLTPYPVMLAYGIIEMWRQNPDSDTVKAIQAFVDTENAKGMN